MIAAEQARPSWIGRQTTLLGFVLIVATALRLHRLDAQLWLDEVSALSGNIRRSAFEIATTWPGTTSHVLYELMAHVGWVLFGEGPVSIRLPAVVFGVAGVWALHRFARSFLPDRFALGAAALLAVSYIHVFQSQNARGYTALIFFALLASAELVRIQKTGAVSRRSGLVYAAAAVLAGYSQLFGVVILPAHLALAGIWWAAGRRTPDAVRDFPLRAFLPWALGGLLAVGLLYLPFLRSIFGFATERAGMPGEGPGLGWGLIRETVEGLTAALGGPVPLIIGAVVGCVGTIVWWRKDFFAFLVVVSPIVVQLAVFAGLGAGVHPRYFAVALPIVYVVGALGLLTSLELGLARIAGLKTRPTRSVAGVAFALAVLASALPLRDYYRFPKQDFLGALDHVEANAAAGDAKVGIGSTGRVLSNFYGADFVVVDDLEGLSTVEAGTETVWVVTSLEGLLSASVPDLVQHVRHGYERVEFLPGTVGDGAMRVYRTRAAPDA